MVEQTNPTLATVIIPCAPHHLGLLHRAIHSASIQTVPNVEVLYYIDEGGGTPAIGRNILAKRARGLFLVQLDADDYLLPNAIEEWLKVWTPGSYVTSDFYMEGNHVHAVSCYGLRRKPDEVNFHLPPSLFPTAYWHKLGGQDETIFGAEDTKFFFTANIARIGHHLVRKPLFVYTGDGQRSKKAHKDSRWNDLLSDIWSMRSLMSMACCGDIAPLNLAPQGRQDGDILVSPTFQPFLKTRGRSTGRDYGVINNTFVLWISPEDFNTREFRQIEDWQSASPTTEQINRALQVNPDDPLALLELDIRKAGVRLSYNPDMPFGYDIQQHPTELARLLLRCQELGVSSVLEIGTGANAGLARYMVNHLGWRVTSVDMTPPSPDAQKHIVPSGRWSLVLGDSRELDLANLQESYDLVIIDGDHSYDGAKSDWERFSSLASKVVVVHDVSPDSFFPDGVTKFWEELAKTPKTKQLRSGFFEVVAPHSKLGVGWLEVG